MRILLVANYKPDQQRSMARYAEFLHAELRNRGHAAEIIHPPVIATRLMGRGNRLFRWLAYLDKFVFFPPLLRLRARRADVVHVCDHSNSWYLRWTGNTPNVITAHDALAIRSALGHFPQNPTRASGVVLQRWILRGLTHADWIACVSDKTRRDFESLLPAQSRMSVIGNPVDRSFRPARADDVKVLRASLGIAPEKEYLLHVGKDNWYKNRPGVLRIMAELRKLPRFSRVKLVMAGAPLPPALRETADSIGGVVELPGPTDEQLRALYTGALALLFPSFEEGFGWPILEAQACGCAVITSARPPMMDVAGDAAILIDPEEAASAAAAISGQIEEVPRLRQAGLANVRAFSMDSTVERYCGIYHELASASPRKRKSRGEMKAAV
ncbi:MAG TPA: glycosyltransferase family 1 protein [Candidatus Angelobacter sp.]|nr:glycosyltransferase family 1 protein [Candidatus Angelobacter sp.]